MCLTPCSSGTFHTVLSDAFIRFLLSLRVVTASYTWLPPLSLTLRKPPKAGYPLHPQAVAVKHATLNWQQNPMPAFTNHTPWLWNMTWPHACLHQPHTVAVKHDMTPCLPSPTTHRGCETWHGPMLILTYQPHIMAMNLQQNLMLAKACWALPLTCMYKGGTKLRELPLHVHCSSCSRTHSQSPGSKACEEFGCHTCLYINHSIH